MVISSPPVAGGEVYVGSFDGRVYAFDLAGGHSVRRPKLGDLRPDPSLRPSR
jgi:outer membrane protein assembly factor BamB